VSLAALIAADRHGLLLKRTGDWARFHGKAFVVQRVIDGDTLDVMAPGATAVKENLTRVRLWAIDTPELARRDRGTPAEPFAQEAKAFAMRVCEGKIVTLQLEAHRLRGKYGRLLAFVVLEDGRCLNAMLVERGLARAERRFSHSRLKEYEALEARAKAARQGMWGGRPSGAVISVGR